MNKEMLKLIVGTGSGILIGGFVGYVVTQRVLSRKYENELADQAAYYKNRLSDYDDIVLEEAIEQHEDFLLEESTGEFEPKYYTPEELEALPEEELEILREELQRDLIEKGKNSKVIKTLGYGGAEEARKPSLSEVREEIDERLMTIEESTPIDPDDEILQRMIEERKAEIPYVITIDEFMMDDLPGYENVSVTYFDGDGNLTDSQDRIIPEVDELLGSDNLTKFGLFSKDKNIVYIRNDRHKMNFEVALDPRSFTEAIAGFTNPKVLRRMREDD